MTLSLTALTWRLSSSAKCHTIIKSDRAFSQSPLCMMHYLLQLTCNLCLITAATLRASLQAFSFAWSYICWQIQPNLWPKQVRKLTLLLRGHARHPLHLPVPIWPLQCLHVRYDLPKWPSSNLQRQTTYVLTIVSIMMWGVRHNFCRLFWGFNLWTWSIAISHTFCYAWHKAVHAKICPKADFCTVHNTTGCCKTCNHSIAPRLSGW